MIKTDLMSDEKRAQPKNALEGVKMTKHAKYPY